MRAHCLHHVPFEGLGSIAVWLEKTGYEVTRTGFFDGAGLPDLRAVDLIIIMGGPMSVNDEAAFPWLIAEKRFIREAIGAQVPMLGVCLGAQLIANAAGAKVFRNPVREIGWFPIYGIPGNDSSVFQFPESVDVFHWHGETFDLPQGAVRIAKSDGCQNQAFQLGRSAIGLQFHLETTPQTAGALVAHCADELTPAPYVQTAEDILQAGPGRYAAINRLMDDVLSFLARP
ncbi:MAG: type 1 glutamine amidotransferase [Deltaproteobacteria bacterium]|nr:type 1 glutamine amidotransferase [Deltaproteobacteria bacterium]